jgi:hypothetical protein
MQRSIYLAKLIGPVLLVIGLGMLLNGAVYRAMAVQFLHTYSLIYMSGLLTLVAGIALVHAHNVWEGDWRLIITVLGWLGIIGGAVRILVPQFVETIGGSVVAQPAALMAGGFVVLALGGVLSYFGYAELIEKASRRTKPRARKRSRR